MYDILRIIYFLIFINNNILLLNIFLYQKIRINKKKKLLIY